MEIRMNGSCAGGTGAFIDQMASLLSISPTELNELAMKKETIYTIASRCGVFAKTDIQPLLNQGAKKEDISASIFYSVVNQTIAGLAQGRKIEGNVIYLGGPLTFFTELRKAFDDTLNLTGICPENSLYYVALGAAICAKSEYNISQILLKYENKSEVTDVVTTKPLFGSSESFDEFRMRHSKAQVIAKSIDSDTKEVFLGVDAGSTTVKTAIISKEGELLHSTYQNNNGNAVVIIQELLKDLYEKYPNLKIVSSASTGYGEELIKNAFQLDYGIVETVAHYNAARKFMPDVNFIIDIGGQDIKCFKIHNGVIDKIYLNEACSSGCGSFLQTFANAMGYSVEDFAQKGVFADAPVDLGSRCTVFMNSSVKQAQKDGISTENISAGLSISVIKNALYKVIRPSSKEELGNKIVVQGGTFYNDAVLRAFEQELEVEVVRPNISGLMGAYGAALYAAERYLEEKSESNILKLEEVRNFTHDVNVVNCGLCQNNCSLTVNKFEGNRKFISGNRCERPFTQKSQDSTLNLYSIKLELLKAYEPIKGGRGRIGIPFGLNRYELLPFWHRFFTELGFEVVASPISDRNLYLKGQTSIPSDTVCYPAKLMHGHVEELISMGIKTIFYPCMSYNLDEKLGDNCYNCPVVAYYPEILNANMSNLEDVNFIFDYLGIHRKKDLPKKLYAVMQNNFQDISLKEVKAAVKKAYEEYDLYMNKVYEEGEAIIQKATENGKHIIVLAGRPYHIDPEINHGIDQLISNFDVAIISEDVLSKKIEKKPKVDVLNQWTYHSRLYAAAEYVSKQSNMDLVQLVSFGCGCDAITTDECREILEKKNKIYTQIKIDEITNLGAVKIRMRSLFAAIGLDK